MGKICSFSAGRLSRRKNWGDFFFYPHFSVDLAENPARFQLTFTSGEKASSMSDDSSDDELAAPMATAMYVALTAASAIVLSQQIAQQTAVVAVQTGAVCAERRPPVMEERIDYLSTPWMRLLRDKKEALGDACSKHARKFRLDFRIPYPVFLQLVQACEQHGWLRCGAQDAAGRPAIPVELKLLAVLYLLGSGAALRTVAALSGISEPTVQRALHRFCSEFASAQYDEWIRPHKTEEELATVLRHYAAAGFPGAVGSSDVTHVPWDKTPSQQGRYYTGKEGFPTIAYEVLVSSRFLYIIMVSVLTGSWSTITCECPTSLQQMNIADMHTTLCCSVLVMLLLLVFVGISRSPDASSGCDSGFSRSCQRQDDHQVRWLHAAREEWSHVHCTQVQAAHQHRACRSS